MQLRRLRSHRLPLLAAGALLASPLLAGCGFNYATDRVNTISTGTNDRTGSVDVLGAVVIAGQDDAGLFVATLVNKESEEISLDTLEPTEQVQPLGEVTPVEVAPGGRASLFQTGGVAVGGDFQAGDFVSVTLSFSDGQTSTVEVAVVAPCRQYSLDKLTELTLPEPAAIDPGTGTESAAPTDEATVTTEPEPTEGEELTDEEHGVYSCDPLPPVEHHAEEGEGE